MEKERGGKWSGGNGRGRGEERLKKERRDDKYKREHAYEELMRGDDEEAGGGKLSNQDGFDEDDFM